MKTKLISAKDVIYVADCLKMTLTLQEIDEVLEMYDDENDLDPTGTWGTIVENCIYNIKNVVGLKIEHLVYMSDAMYLPISYKGFEAEQPFFRGKGNHSVKELENICEQFTEYVHQQQVIKQNCMKHILELKFGVDFNALKIK